MKERSVSYKWTLPRKDDNTEILTSARFRVLVRSIAAVIVVVTSPLALHTFVVRAPELRFRTFSILVP